MFEWLRAFIYGPKPPPRVLTPEEIARELGVDTTQFPPRFQPLPPLKVEATWTPPAKPKKKRKAAKRKSAKRKGKA